MDELAAYFPTNGNRRGGGFRNGFHRGSPKEIRLDSVELTKSDGAWTTGTAKTFPERSRPTASGRRARSEWSLLASTTDFQTIRDAGIRNGTSDVLVFIHGAGNSFTDAAVTAAGMAEHYSEPGSPVCPFFLCYPANGSSEPVNYFRYRDAAVPQLAQARRGRPPWKADAAEPVRQASSYRVGFSPDRDSLATCHTISSPGAVCDSYQDLKKLQPDLTAAHRCLRRDTGPIPASESVGDRLHFNA